MKIRNGFVSNSSSSSYICDVCGHDESGWDLCLSDAEMVECASGHVMCCSHVEATKAEIYIAMVEEGIEKYGNTYDHEDKLKEIQVIEDEKERENFCNDALYETDWEYSFPSKLCPICSLKQINDSELVQYLKHGVGIDMDSVMKDMRSKFKDYDEFQTFLIERRKNEN